MNKQKQMISVDLLRIYACFSVMAVHLAIITKIPGRLGRFMEAGSNGLGIFYILSGFLIFLSLDRLKTSGETLRRWYVKRMVRILPMYYFMVLSYMIIYEFIKPQYMKPDPNGIKWTGYFLCINTIVKNPEVFWQNLAALSSMSIFVWFYILAPLIRKFVNCWEKSLAFLAVSYLVMRVLQHTEWLTMFRAYYYFAVGILVYYSIKNGKQKLNTFISLAAVILMIQLDARGGLMYALVVGMILQESVEVSLGNPRLNRVIEFLSKRTFAIYLGHTGALQIMDAFDFSYEFPIVYISFIVLTVIITEFLYRVIEKGSVRLMNYYLSRNNNPES